MFELWVLSADDRFYNVGDAVGVRELVRMFPTEGDSIRVAYEDTVEYFQVGMIIVRHTGRVLYTFVNGEWVPMP